MLRRGVMPCLLLDDESLVKTVKFKSPAYVGDPFNAIRIFNELEVDELILLDIRASENKEAPNFEFIHKAARECFMPLTYGGGISSLGHAERLFTLGVEKVSLNKALFNDPNLITNISNKFGSQAVIASIDYNKPLFGGPVVYSDRGQNKTKYSPIEWAQKAEDLGAGEILLTSIKQEGTWDGYDIDMISAVTEAVSIPVIANGGAGNNSDLKSGLFEGGASGVSAGSMFVFQKKGMGVLVNFPPQKFIEEIIVAN